MFRQNSLPFFSPYLLSLLVKVDWTITSDKYFKSKRAGYNFVEFF